MLVYATVEDPSRQLTFSVVVPVRNGATLIDACIESLLAQRYPSECYEIIIVDNGSTDGTERVVGAYPVTLLNCATPGPSPARNVGVRHARHQIVAFTDADCVADPGWLSGLAKAFADDRVGAAGGAIEAYRHPGRNFVEQFSDDRPPLRNYQSGDGEFLPFLMGANAAYRRAPLLAVGAWDADMSTAEDIELAWRFQLTTGARLVYCDDAVIFHRHRSTVRALARQYRTYGMGEVLLDTLFGSHRNYPRTAHFYWWRMPRQLAALPRYVASGGIRALRRLRGRASTYDAAFPWLQLVAETANIVGKVRGLVLSRGLRDAEPLRRYLAITIPTSYVPRVKTA